MKKAELEKRQVEVRLKSMDKGVQRKNELLVFYAPQRVPVSVAALSELEGPFRVPLWNQGS